MQQKTSLHSSVQVRKAFEGHSRMDAELKFEAFYNDCLISFWDGLIVQFPWQCETVKNLEPCILKTAFTDWYDFESVPG